MYLILKCEPLNDQYECDANRTPYCITEDCSKFGVGYEVYEIISNGHFKKVKDYDVALDEGIAVYWWNAEDTSGKPTVFCKFAKVDRDHITCQQVKKLRKYFKFTDSLDHIIEDIRTSGAHSEQIGDKWVVIGEYADDYYREY